MNDTDIPKVKNVTDLGFIISDDLSWKVYVDKIRAKANTLSFAILRKFRSNNYKVLLTLISWWY